MKKIKYNDEYIYVDDSPVDEKETGVMIDNSSILEDTLEIPKKEIEDSLEKTLTNVWGNDDNE